MTSLSALSTFTSIVCLGAVISAGRGLFIFIRSPEKKSIDSLSRFAFMAFMAVFFALRASEYATQGDIFRVVIALLVCGLSLWALIGLYAKAIKSSDRPK